MREEAIAQAIHGLRTSLAQLARVQATKSEVRSALLTPNAVMSGGTAWDQKLAIGLAAVSHFYSEEWDAQGREIA